MKDDELRKIAREIMLLVEAGAPGGEHVRLQKKLDEWAQGKGFDEELNAIDGKRPDVLRRRQKAFLFVGEAKDAANETADNDDSLSRLGNYIWSFSEALKQGQIKGGVIAVATNDNAAATGWATALVIAARLAKIRRSDGQGPRVDDLGEKTWVAWW